MSVTSEIGRLRRVLVHEPGPEVDRMVPAMMDELLFDDILYGERAREEHRRFRRLLELLDVEVLDAADLLAGALGVEGGREWLLDVLRGELDERRVALLAELPPGELAVAVATGVRGGAAGGDELYEIAPLPNWCFQRDPQIVIGSGVVFSAMATDARWREGLLARAAFRFHPQLSDTPTLLDPLAADSERGLLAALHRPRLEGGDVLVLSPDAVAVGRSERTSELGAHYLAEGLARVEGGPRWLVVVDVPHRRAFMHLDTVMTPVDRDALLVHEPVIVGSSAEPGAAAWVVDLHARERTAVATDGVLDALGRVGCGCEPIPCGGADPVTQQREQWTDGANCLAVAPGTICLYDRNTATAEELDRHGFRIVHAEDLLLGRTDIEPDDGGRTCVLLDSHEICRARGGPHCLSHPLERDPA